MEKSSKNTSLIIIIIIALLFIGYLYYITIPRKVPVSQVVVVPTDLLDNDQAKEIEKASSFGNIPVAVSEPEKGRPDPFAGI